MPHRRTFTPHRSHVLFDPVHAQIVLAQIVLSTMPGAHDGLSGNHGSGDAPRRHGFHMVMRNRGHTDYGGGGRAEGMKRGRDAAGQSRREKRRKMMRPKTTAIRRQQEVTFCGMCLAPTSWLF